jgi:hypothetical protein
MCSDCNLESYSAYGGRWQRTDRNAGRVASVFAPAGAQVPYGYDEVADADSILEQDPSEASKPSDRRDAELEEETPSDTESDLPTIEEAAYWAD